MSAPAEPVPTLELPSDKLMQWSQLALLLAAQLAARRERLERLAWSEGEHAARAHDIAQVRAVTEPAVRAMTAREIAQWPRTQAEPASGEGAPRVTARVERINDRWALRATARHGEDTVCETWVSCREETLARGLASEIPRRGEPGAVERLAAHVALAEALAEHAATQRAHAQASAPPLDRDAMAAHIQGAWPSPVARAVLGCPAWPTLASKLDAAHRDGHDLQALLRSITTTGIPTARKPAALASYLLEQATGAERTDPGVGSAVPGPRSSLPVEGSCFPPLDPEEILSWVDQLDPRSDIDRVGALGAAGSYGRVVDTRLETRFGGLTEDPARGRGDDRAAESLAGDRERSAAAHNATLDDPSTPHREDLDAQALGERDLHEMAAARATAAESHGAAHATVARASVTTTAPGPATTGHAAPRQATPPPRPRPTQAQSTRSRGR